MERLTERESRCIYYMKAFAIMCVVCAHISLVPDDFSKESQFVCGILREIGAIGVGVFFAISGYLFNNVKNRTMKFDEVLFNKLKVLGIPWGISATLIYIYVAVRKGGSVVEYIRNVLGYMSSYWYLSMTMLLFIIFYFVMRSQRENIVSVILIVVTLAFAILRHFNIVLETAMSVYLNVFSWTLFFSIGFLFRENKNIKQNRIFDSMLFTILLCILSFAILVVMECVGKRFSYFNDLYVPVEMLIILSIYMLCRQLAVKNIRLFIYLGRMSFCIYLYNELLWAGLLVKIGERFDFWPSLLLRPIICIVMVCLEMEMGKWLFATLKKRELFCKLFGIK